MKRKIEEKLIIWKEKTKDRRPLILNGARQVGKVETMELFPMDFEEFLWAMGKEFMTLRIRECFEGMTAMEKGLHREAIEYFRQYMIIGGMPAAVNTFLDTGKFMDSVLVQSEIVDKFYQERAIHS